MKNRRLVSFILLLVAGLTLMAASPSPIGKDVAKTELARFIVDNTSDQPVIIKLHEAEPFREQGVITYYDVRGGQSYYLQVGAGQKRTFTVERATYNYTMTVCGGKELTGAFNITERKEVVIPICSRYDPSGVPEIGGRLSGVTEELTLIRFSMENTTDEYAYVYFNGPESYYLTVPHKSTKQFTVEDGTYSYYYWACGEKSASSSVDVAFNTHIEITCP